MLIINRNFIKILTSLINVLDSKCIDAILLNTSSITEIDRNAMQYLYLHSELISSINLRHQLNMIHEISVDVFSTFQIVVYTGNYPRYQYNVDAMYKDLTYMISASVENGNFTKLLREISQSISAWSTSSVSVSSLSITVVESSSYTYDDTEGSDSFPLEYIVGIISIAVFRLWMLVVLPKTYQYSRQRYWY